MKLSNNLDNEYKEYEKSNKIIMIYYRKVYVSYLEGSISIMFVIILNRNPIHYKQKKNI